MDHLHMGHLAGVYKTIKKESCITKLGSWSLEHYRSWANIQCTGLHWVADLDGAQLADWIDGSQLLLIFTGNESIYNV